MITTMYSDQNASPSRVEVITSVQRRRRWSTAKKIRLVEETEREIKKLDNLRVARIVA
jgi:hypothetical protein